MKLKSGDLMLDTVSRVLRRGELEITLEPKVFDCIAVLMAAAGELTSLKQLRAALWPDARVGDGALRRIINEARKALGDRGDAQEVIRTRKGLGYVFVPPVELQESEAVRLGNTPAAVWPFVGRVRELASLHEWIGPLDRGGLCFVSGEAGVGKSTLIARFAAQSGSRVHWLFGCCRATAGAPAYWPFRELSLQLLREPALRARAQALVEQYPGARQLVPELSGARAIARTDRALHASPELRFERCQEYAALLVSVAQACPLRVVLEDLHWADDGSLALLEALAHAVREQPLQLIATYRPEAVGDGSPLARVISRSSGRAGVVSVHLGPLGLAELHTLFTELQLPAAMARSAPALLQLTGGNALYVHELIRQYMATPAPKALTPLAAVSPSLGHIVAERVALLPTLTQLRLQQAAVLGHEFRLGLLARVAGISRAELGRELDPAERAGLLRQNPHEPDRLQFNHALVADTLAAGLAAEPRKAYHFAALRVLQTLHASERSSSELALHAFEAGEQLSAAERRELCEDAGRDAQAELAFDRAALHLGRALQLLGADDRSQAGAELALHWARARWHADDDESAIEAAFLEAAERARRADSAALLAEAAIGYAVGDESAILLRIASLRPKALLLAEEAWRRLASAGVSLDAWPGHVAYRLASTLCFLQAEAGDPADFERAAQLALQLAPPQLGASSMLWLLALRAVADPPRALYWVGEILDRVRDASVGLHARIEMLAVVLGIQLEHGDLSGWERAVSELARLSELLQRPDRAGRLLLPDGRVGQRMSIYIALPYCPPVMRAVMAGKFADAEAHFAALVELPQRLGTTRTREGDHNGLHILLQLLAYQGRCRELEPLLAQAENQRPQAGWFLSLLRTQIALERGARTEAAAHFACLRASAFRPLLGETPLLSKPETLLRMADACVEIGEPADAEVLYKALAPRAQRFIHDGSLICWGSAGRALGALAFQLGQKDVAEHHHRDALAMNLRINHRPELVRTQLGLARVLFALDRSAEAHGHLAEARREAVNMGMAPLVSAAELLVAG